MNLRVASVVISLLVAVSAIAEAQTFANLSVSIEGRRLQTRGGEVGSAGMSSGALSVGKRVTAVFAQPPDMCGLAVQGFGTPDANATSGWIVHATPLRVDVDDDAVTIRIEWTRSRSGGKQSSGPGGNLEVTLRPGQSLPLDVVELPATSTLYQTCGMLGSILRIGVVNRPSADQDRRLIAADLWLIERTTDGVERSQLQSVRGQLNQHTPFYFDTTTGRGASLDIFGHFTASVDGDSLMMKLATRSRVMTDQQLSSSSMAEFDRHPVREIESTIRLKGDDVIEIQLPRIGENASGAFDNRRYSIRVRAKRIR